MKRYNRRVVAKQSEPEGSSNGITHSTQVQPKGPNWGLDRTRRHVGELMHALDCRLGGSLLVRQMLLNVASPRQALDRR